MTDDIVVLAYAHGIVLGIAREDFDEVYPTAEVVEHLGVDTDEAIFKIERVVRCARGLPIEWRTAFCLELQEF